MSLLHKIAKDILSDIGQRLIDLSETIRVEPARIQRVPVVSDCAASIGYRVSDGTLEVEYHNGRVYQYAAVSFEDYTDLMDGRSIGRFLNREIKPFHTCTEIKG